MDQLPVTMHTRLNCFWKLIPNSAISGVARATRAWSPRSAMRMLASRVTRSMSPWICTTWTPASPRYCAMRARGSLQPWKRSRLSPLRKDTRASVAAAMSFGCIISLSSVVLFGTAATPVP